MKSVIQKLGLKMLPKRLLTTWVGKFSRARLSKWVIPLYIRHYRIDAAEAELPLQDYTSLVSFFARALKPGLRPIDAVGVVSPVDGTVSEFGEIMNGTLVQAKGSYYTLQALVAGDDLAKRYDGGFYITIYLSPRDYHRIHMPVSGTITGWRYVPGSLYPVNAAGVRHVKGLFTKNERLISQIETDTGGCAVVKIGATIVGSIRTPYGPQYESPLRRYRRSITTESVFLDLKRGDEMGRFEFGSTVILLFEPSMVKAVTVKPGQWVNMGQRVAELNNRV